MSLSIIVAVAQNQVIGKDNQLPWHLSEDLKYFKATTMGHPILMGRKTYDSIGRPLPGRRNIVLTRQKDLKINGVEIIHDLDQIKSDEEEIFVIGGSEIYTACLDQVDKIYLTRILKDFDGDAFFPKLDLEKGWKLNSETEILHAEKNGLPYQFVVLERAAR